MEITKKHCLFSCNIKGIFFELPHTDMIDHVIKYYKDKDKNLYLILKKEHLKGKYEKFKKIMKNGGEENIYDLLPTKKAQFSNVQLEIDWYDKNQIIILNDDYDDDVYTYNKFLNMYVNLSSKVFIEPDNNSANEIIFFSYLKIIEII